MRRQFKEQFERIRVEFDKAFKELFGGGKAALELEDPDDTLREAFTLAPSSSSFSWFSRATVSSRAWFSFRMADSASSFWEISWEKPSFLAR